MRRIATAAAALIIGLGSALVAATPAAAATPSLRFHSIQYDSPGKDTRTNASLNAEYVVLVNTGAKAVNLKGYTVRDAAGKKYTFGSVSIAGKGGKVYLHTGKGSNTKKHRYWNSGNYIWNNTGDKATLRNAKGKTVDTCSYGNKSGRTKIAC